jgi:hypothetical protein
LKQLKVVCMAAGMQTMRAVAVNDWKRGLTTLEEVMSETAPDK